MRAKVLSQRGAIASNLSVCVSMIGTRKGEIMTCTMTMFFYSIVTGYITTNQIA